MQICGVIKSIRYTNEKNGYTVCDVQSENKVITFVGTMPLLNVGECIIAEGRFVTHATYGHQFMVESCERRKPSKEDEMRDYLSSGFIKGLGPATARKIVDTFKDKTFHIFENEPHRLTEIKGISPQKALLFSQAFIERENIRHIVMLLNKFNVSSSYAMKVWKRYGTYAETEIQKNPFLLAESDIGLNFSVCDRIASYYGIEPYYKERLKSALLYILNKFTASGNTYANKTELLNEGAKLTKVSEEFLIDAFDSLMLEGRIYVEKRFPDRVYIDSLFQAEKYCSQKLNLLNETFDDFNEIETDKLLGEFEKNNDIYLDEDQKKAIKSALNQGVFIITGGPGTGKTTIIKSLINIFESKRFSVTLTAPTGRAAKRISETTGCEAKTIHRLLEVGYSIDDEEEPYFMRNEDNPLDFDVIIIDEASMIDIILMSALLKAVLRGTRLILVGDVDQLPSVGPGKVLSDIIESEKFPVAKLTTIFRQAEQSLIVTNAHLINQGLMPHINSEEGDFYFIPRMTSQDTAKT
ncbi:MAG: AAA family ATPase, partial [Clostridiaceae bacterium]|nr:AAA family ATPase [Clostridiaceae bacterium]